MGELDGQVALVTGGGRGIGRAIARALASAGAAVAITARSADQLDETAMLIAQDGGKVLALPADVTDPDAVEQVVETVEQRLGPLSLLVNNAGTIGPIAPVWEIDPAAWRQCMDVNLYGTFLCTRLALPAMRSRGSGRIINLAGSSPVQPVPYGICYDATKTAILRFTEGLAIETRADNLSVFALAPGAVHTAMVDELVSSPWALKLDPTMRDFATRWATPPDHPAALCVYLASGQADALSGRYLSVSMDVADLVRREEEVRQRDLYTLRLRR